MRVILYTATALALALFLWLRTRPPPLPASVTMLPSAASPLLEEDEPEIEDLRTLLHHGDPVVCGRALERVRALGRTDILDGNDLARTAALAGNGAEFPRRTALLLLLDLGYVDWFPRTAEFLATTRNPITRDLLLHELVARGGEHRAKLEEWASEKKPSPRSMLAREVRFWLQRNQIPALPPGYADGEASGPRASQLEKLPTAPPTGNGA